MIKDFVKAIRNFHRDDSGDVVQTAILVAVFSVLAIGGYMFLAPMVKNLFNKAGNELQKGNSYTY